MAEGELTIMGAYRFRVIKSTWGIAIDIEGKAVDKPEPFREVIDLGGGVKFTPNLILSRNETYRVRSGLEMVRPYLPSPVLIQIDGLKFNPTDYQENALPYAVALWAAQEFGFEPPTLRVSYNKMLRKYIFEMDKKEPSVTVTERAAKEIQRIAKEQAESGEKGKLYLRVRVVGGGCSGFQHKLDLTSERNDEKDMLFEQHGVEVLVDRRSLLYADGAVVDYVEDLNQRGFTVKNPHAKTTCGCGSSFSM